jgi:UDP-N-acetylmuramoyl-tripeptide--D-alanyl-D-alanine ligase
VIPLTLAEVAALTSGDLHLDCAKRSGGRARSAQPDSRVTAVVIDSREVASGSLFLAFPGERADGHDFASAAWEAGAAAVLATRPVDVPHILLPDTTDTTADMTSALGQLAAEVIRQLPGLRVIAVTGSAGKTTTKDLLASVLPTVGPTIAPVGSYNNDLGVPLTICRCDEDTRLLVLEMGARGSGHLARLCAIAPPSIGVVLNVGSAHLGEFGSREAIAAAKSEVARAARDVAVLNADDPLVAAMAADARVPVVTFGRATSAQVRAEDVRVDDEGRATFRLRAGGGTADVALRLVGEHHVGNALAAAAVALQCGLDLPAVATALSAAEPRSRWRMEVSDSSSGVTVINDAYNANPESMRAALTTLTTRGRTSSRRTWAVLGEMAELGPTAETEHQSLGRFAVRSGVSHMIVVGDHAGGIHAGAVAEASWQENSMHVADVQEAIDVLREQVRSGDIVLVKGSRVAGLERVAEALLSDSAIGAAGKAVGGAG